MKKLLSLIILILAGCQTAPSPTATPIPPTATMEPTRPRQSQRRHRSGPDSAIQRMGHGVIRGQHTGAALVSKWQTNSQMRFPKPCGL